MYEYMNRIVELLTPLQEAYEIERDTVENILKNCHRCGNFSSSSTDTTDPGISPEQVGDFSESSVNEIPEIFLADELLAKSMKIRLKFQEKANRSDAGNLIEKAVLKDDEQSRNAENGKCDSSATLVLTQKDYLNLKNLGSKTTFEDPLQKAPSNSCFVRRVGETTIVAIPKPFTLRNIPKVPDVSKTLRKVLKENEKLVCKVKEMLRRKPSRHWTTFLSCLESDCSELVQLELPADEIVYSDIGDVKEMFRLYHQIHSVQILLHLHQVLKSDIIPLLSRMDANQSDYKIISQFCHTMLNEEIL